MGRYLADSRVRPDVILCSSAVRTQQTLERLQPALGDAAADIEDELYAAGSSALLERLQRLPEGAGSVLLIAHNPGLKDLALLLAGSGPDLGRLGEKFPTGALATIEVDTAWADLRPGAGELVQLVFPRELR